MAATGAALIVFVVGHLLGNLQIFLGPEPINAYAETLQSFKGPLWAARLGLLAAVALHIWAATSLTLQNRRARPEAYAKKEFVRATYASRTMAWSGLIVGCYIVYHLLHFTVGFANPSIFHLTDPQGRYDIYSMMVLGFQNVYVSGFYILSMVLLAMHMSHGFSSAFQSMGANNDRSLPVLGRAGQIFSWAIFLGYASIPAAVLLGVVQLPPWRQG